MRNTGQVGLQGVVVFLLLILSSLSYSTLLQANLAGV
jgi:hypothetical protein